MNHDGGHPRPALGAWNLNAVHSAVGQLQSTGDRYLDLRRGHVLSAPAKRIAGAVTKVNVTQFVFHQNVTYKDRNSAMDYVHLKDS